MPDERSHGPWVIDPDIMIGMRLKKGRESLGVGDAATALLEAEELLDEHPGHVEALQLAGEASLKLRDAPHARATFEQLITRGPGSAFVHEALGVARFECADFDAALASLKAALEASPNMARACYYQGLILERTGDAEGALRCFDRAFAIAPEDWPVPRNYSDAAWDEALTQGRKLLPGPIRSFYAKVPIRWQRFPDASELRASFPPLSPLSYALFEGQPPVDGDPWTDGPSSVRLYRGNLRHGAKRVEDLARRIAEALLNEAAAWLGVIREELG